MNVAKSALHGCEKVVLEGHIKPFDKTYGILKFTENKIRHNPKKSIKINRDVYKRQDFILVFRALLNRLDCIIFSNCYRLSEIAFSNLCDMQ